MRIAVAAGGTGGHVYPAVAVATGLMHRGDSVLWIGRPESLEESEAKALGAEFSPIRLEGLKRRLTWKNLRALARFVTGRARARRVLVRFRADVLFALGSYVSAPVISAALSVGVPVLVHEQNVVPGLVVSRYARKVNRVLLTKPLAGNPLTARAQVVGMPLRPGILMDRRPEWFSEFRLKPDRKTLLIFGGSQGARVLCRTGLELARQWETSRPGWQVLLQTGAANLGWVEAEKPPQNVVLISHIGEMGKAYACADLIVARSGAVSCAELEVVGKPAVLVPYPHATRDHQRLNAEAFVRENGGRIVLEQDLTADVLEDALHGLEGIVARGRDLSTVSAPVEKIIAARDEAAGGGRS